MIFVCLGTKRFQFDRLLKQVDILIDNGAIQEKVIAQAGHSTYSPQNFEYKRFLSSNEYDAFVEQAKIIITHGGTGAIIKALKARKQIIAVPRLQKFGEHSDDHQLQIVNFFTENGYIRKVDKINELEFVLKELKEQPIKKVFKGKGTINKIIDDFITGC